MNIAKLQSQLQHVPDQALIGYVQNPDGQVPSYLALAELTRRKEIRKSGAPQQSAPTQSVAQQAVAEVEPGIAQLPLKDDQMFSEQAYATGGIVAFEDGGEVQHFRKGGDFQSAYSNYQNYLTDPVAYDPYATSSAAERLFGESPLQAYERAKQEEAARLYHVTGSAIGAAGPRAIAPEPGIFTRTTPAERTAYANRDELIANFKAGKYDPTKQSSLQGPYAPNMDPVAIAQREAELIKNRNKPTPPTGGRKDGAPVTQDKLPAPATQQGFDRLTYQGPTDYSSEYDATLRPEISAQEAMAKYKGLLGTDVGREKMQERLNKMEAKAVRDEERAPWMALAEAGLGIASGKSQSAIQNISEGGVKGIKSYADARDRLDKAEERRFEIASKIAQADRAEQVAAATYGIQSEEAARAGREANRLAKLGYKANLASDKAKGEFDAKKGNLEADLTKAKLDEDSAWHKLQYKADMARTGVMGANAQFTKEQAQANNLLKIIMAPDIAALKNQGYTEEDAQKALLPEALNRLPPKMLEALGYTPDFVKGMGSANTNDYVKLYGITPKSKTK